MFNARQGKSVDLRCLLDRGTFARSIRWDKENDRIPTKAQEMMDGSLLRIPDVDESDGGRYICSNGRSQQYIILRVERIPGKLELLKTLPLLSLICVFSYD